MDKTHWSARLPYIVPVWHQLGQRNVHPNQTFDMNLELDVGGIGMYGTTEYKKLTPCPYQIDRPMLPYFVAPYRHHSEHVGNCLAYCPRNSILFSTKYNRIYAHQLVENVDQSAHSFAYQHSVNPSPFLRNIAKSARFQVGKIHKTKRFFELKVCDTETSEGTTDLLAISRESMKLLTYSPSDQKSDLALEVDLKSPLFPQKNSRLNFVERNQIKQEEYLVGFFRDGHTYRWDVEREHLSIDYDLKLDFAEKVSKFVGLQWAVDLNPFLYFCGTHSTIGLLDTRVDNADHNSMLVVADYQRFPGSSKNEIFQAFTTCKLEPHQVITSTDFKINFLDIRYPNVNMFSTTNMFAWKDISQMRRSNLDDRQLILLSSNRKQCCLNSFEIGPELQPKQQHFPFHINLPHDIDAVYPTFDCEDQYFFNGIEVLPGKDESTFSVAVLLNSGDIFLQDFKRPSSVKVKPEESIDLSDYKYQNEVGKKVYINREIDSVTLKLLEEVKSYHEKRRAVTMVSKYPKQGHVKCVRCQKKKCDNVLAKELCQCLSSHLIQKEKEMLEQDSSDDDARQSTYLHPPLNDLRSAKLFRDDKLDLDQVRDNWHRVSQAPDCPGVASICGKLTAKLFDRWVSPPPAEDDDHNIPSTSSSTYAKSAKKSKML